MSAKSARGAKRKCQNEECAAPFYDLNRAEFSCPQCGTEFDHEAAAQALEPQPSRYPSRKQPRVLPIVASDEPAGSEDDALSEDVDDSESDDEEASTAASTPGDVLLEAEDDDNLAEAIAIPAVNDNDET
jgi:hypothetical protein